jgi:hypothetical protein
MQACAADVLGRVMWRIVIVGAFAVGVAACLPEDKRSNEAQHNLEQERECGKQAARAFNEQWKQFDKWESHYNSKLNRCLLKVLVTEDPWTTWTAVVVDADTRHVIARYSGTWARKASTFNWETGSYPTPICKKRDDGKDGAECDNYTAFEKLVAEQRRAAPHGRACARRRRWGCGGST